MDFAALMSKEISKSKGDSDHPKESKKENKKYVRRGDEEAARIAAYNEEQDRLRHEREQRATQKRKLEDEEAERRRERDAKKQKLAEESRRKREHDEAQREREQRKKLGLPELPQVSAEATPETEDQREDEKEQGQQEDIPDDELNGKLRDLKEPICLFGETHETRLRRYRRLFRRAMAPRPKLSDGPLPTTMELVPEVDMKISPEIPNDPEARHFLLRQLVSYFNMVLAEWDDALARRDPAVKQSLMGKQAYNAMAQSRDNLRPLVRKLEKGDVDNGMLDPIVEVVHKAQERRYVDANDAYLRLSIGKA